MPSKGCDTSEGSSKCRHDGQGMWPNTWFLDFAFSPQTNSLVARSAAIWLPNACLVDPVPGGIQGFCSVTQRQPPVLCSPNTAQSMIHTFQAICQDLTARNAKLKDLYFPYQDRYLRIAVFCPRRRSNNAHIPRHAHTFSHTPQWRTNPQTVF
ncbi:hypothetical protein LX36DRAFT_418417 [Colletotrichum falcatum]|nr:hypothetical protein LX36DRAFT_418417 [Colletotrichum falcatum]